MAPKIERDQSRSKSALGGVRGTRDDPATSNVLSTFAPPPPPRVRVFLQKQEHAELMKGLTRRWAAGPANF